MENNKIILEEYYAELEKEVSSKVNLLESVRDSNPLLKIYSIKDSINFILNNLMGEKSNEKLTKEEYMERIGVGKKTITTSINFLCKAYDELVKENLNLGYLKGQLDIMSKLLNIKDEPTGNDKMEEKKSDK